MYPLGCSVTRFCNTLTSNVCAQVRSLIAEGVAKTKVKTSDFRFKPVKGWLGGEVTEKQSGWKTRVYEVQATSCSHIANVLSRLPKSST